jgi:hypothetical protein
VRRHVAILALGVLTYAGAALARQVPGLVETAYSGFIGPVVIRVLAFVSGLVPISLAEWVVVGYAAWLAGAGATAIRSVAVRRRRLRNAAAGGALRLLRDAGVVLMLFYATWGLNYARPSLERRFGWPEWDGASLGELQRLGRELVAAANAAYLELHGVEDAGAPTTLPGNLRSLTRDLEAGWREAVRVLELPAPMEWRYGPVKPLLSTPLVGRLGITGFYFPFTGEANLLAGMPAITLPERAGHELAHQRGVGTEAEASFLGFAAAALAPNAHARYSALMDAQWEILAAIRQLEPDSVRALLRDRLPGIQRDVDDVNAYFRQFRGPATAVGTAVNDTFLRANRVAGGVENYRRVVRLLVQFSRENQGSVIPR